MERHLHTDLPGVEDPPDPPEPPPQAGGPPQRRGKAGAGKRFAPYLLAAPAGLWQILFFLIPMFAMLQLSLQSGNSREGFAFTWQFSNYTDGITENATYFYRSFRNGFIVTIAALLIAYPLAYWIAFYGGKRKSSYLLLVLLPFFVSFVIRTLSWKFILSDDGFILGPLKDLHLVPQDFRVLATTFAVIAGITYNLLPFTVLPLFVSLDRIDKRLVEAAGDLYASKAQAFWKVVFPLSLPGVFAAVLLTFIPAIGDYLSVDLLGGTNSTMIGNRINLEFLQNRNYPAAAALAFIVMLLMVIGATLYARLLGTEEITT